jgi:hypothetical protein
LLLQVFENGCPWPNIFGKSPEICMADDDGFVGRYEVVELSGKSAVAG